jgi:hypothetical protein
MVTDDLFRDLYGMTRKMETVLEIACADKSDKVSLINNNIFDVIF